MLACSGGEGSLAFCIPSLQSPTHQRQFELWLLALEDTFWKSAYLEEMGVRKQSHLYFCLYSDHFDLDQGVALILPYL